MIMECFYLDGVEIRPDWTACPVSLGQVDKLHVLAEQFNPRDLKALFRGAELVGREPSMKKWRPFELLSRADVFTAG